MAPFTIDSNILVYAVDADAGSKHRVALDVVARAATANCVLTVQALAEFFFVTTRKGHLAADAAEQMVSLWKRTFGTTVFDTRALDAAMALVRDRRLAFWDAALIAAARGQGCRHLISEDMQHGQSIEGLEIVNPFAEDAVATLAQLMPTGR